MPIGKPGPKREIKPERSFWLVLDDPCGLTCAIITYFVVFFVDYITVRRVIVPSYFNPSDYRYGIVHFLFFQSVIGLICWSHLKCMLSNPGTLTRVWPSAVMDKVCQIKEAQKDQEERRKKHGYLDEKRIYVPWCSRCDNYKPKHTHHCSQCGTCVENMDHHCPWMNNCVGKQNHKFFMLFLLYVGTGSLYSICMTGVRLYSCYRYKNAGAVALSIYTRLQCAGSSAPFTIVGYIMSIIFSFLFCLFVTCMCWEQLEEIGDVTTMIEKKKGMEAERRGVVKGLEVVFQEERSYRWLLPLRPKEMLDSFPRYGDIVKTYGWSSIVISSVFLMVMAYWSDLLIRLLVIKYSRKFSN